MGKRRLRISETLFLELFAPGTHPGYDIIENGLSNVAILAIEHNAQFGWIDIVLASSAFDGPAEGEDIPMYPPIKFWRGN